MITKIPLFSILALLVAACVTVNVYFPVAAVEEAANKFVGQVYQKSTPAPDHEPVIIPDDDIWESKSPTSGIPLQLVNVFISPAYAQINIDISSPRIQILRDNMVARHQMLKHGYDIGAIGITNDGLVVLRDSNEVSFKNLPKIKRWIEEENQERLNLYKEIALANAHPEWEIDIRTTFISRWIELAELGWWYQDIKGQWQRKE